MVELWRTLFDQWTGQHRFATLWLRCAAAFLDFLPFLPLAVVGYLFRNEWINHSWGWIWPATGILVSSAYFIVFHTKYGATPGKALMRCRLLDADEQSTISLRQAALREAPWIALGVFGIIPASAASSKYLDSLWLFGCLACALYDLKNRTLDDIFAGVVLVRIPSPVTQPNETQPPPATLPGHLEEALPIRRTGAAVLNLAAVFGPESILHQWHFPGTSWSDPRPVTWWLVWSSLLVAFWLGCSWRGTSPGATLLGIRYLGRDNRRLPISTNLLRSLPYISLVLSMLATRQQLLPTVSSFVYTVCFLFLTVNGFVIVVSSRSLLDRIFGVRTLQYRTPTTSP